MCADVFRAWRDIVLRDPLLFFLTVLIIVGCIWFAVSSRRQGSPRWKTGCVAFLGFLHGLAHIVLALVLIKFAGHLIDKNWVVHFTALPLGAIPGSLLVAFYLLLGNLLLDAHDQEVLSDPVDSGSQMLRALSCDARCRHDLSDRSRTRVPDVDDRAGR